MIGEIVSAGANFIGGMMNRAETRRANEQNAAIARENIALQKQFAQEGVRWKVEDAKAAGIHPLYALGANTTSFSPVSVGAVADSSLGNAMAAAGQDLSRAINTGRTNNERVTAFDATVQKLQLQKMGLENDLLASQIAKLRQTSNPPLPSIDPKVLVPTAKEYEESPKLRGDMGPWSINPRVVNAEDVEKRYGDIAQELWGAYVMGADMLNHARQNTTVRTTGRRGDWWDYVPRIRFNRHHTFKERWEGERR